MEEKLGSTKKLNNPYFTATIGTLNRQDPLVVYFDGHGFIEPTIEMEDYDKYIVKLKHSFKYYVIEFLNRNSEYFDSDIIYDFQIPSESMKYGKKTAVNFQVLFRQISKKYSIKELNELFSEELNTIISNFTAVANKNNFNITISKKKNGNI